MRVVAYYRVEKVHQTADGLYQVEYVRHEPLEHAANWRPTRQDGRLAMVFTDRAHGPPGFQEGDVVSVTFERA